MPSFRNVKSPAKFKLRSNERKVLLLLGDGIASIFSFIIALFLWSLDDLFLEFSFGILRNLPTWFYLLPVFFIILLSGIYDEHRADDSDETLRGIAFAAIISLGVYMVLYFVSDTALPRRGVAYFFASAVVLTLVWRLAYIKIFTAPQFLHRVVLVGGGETGQLILKIYNDMLPKPFIMVGIIDDDAEKIGTKIEGYSVFGSSEQLLDTIREMEITDLIVAISGQMNGNMFQTLLDCQESGLEIIRMPVAYEELLGRVPIRYLETDWILRSFVDQKMRGNIYYELTKRLIDIVSGLAGLLILAPLFPFIFIAILVDDGFPVFYTQKRMGKGGNLYNIIKFRTMIKNAEPDGQPKWAEENDNRTTSVGRFLRKTHLDEFPQFVNVLRGEMSLVGPRAERPELVQWFQHQVPFYRARLLVKPGITGWAQVNQDYASTISETVEKLEYDLYYIKRRNLLIDLEILLKTPATIFGLKGR